MKKTWLIFFLVFSTLFAWSQENEKDSHHDFKHHRIAYGLGNSHIPKGQNSAGGTFKLFIPTWSLEYEYWFNHNWGVGLHSDLEFMTYVIEEHDGSVLEREFPLMFTLIGARRIKKGLIFYAGPGIELEKHKNLFVLQLGLAYEFELPNNWDLSPSYVYTGKEDVYNTYTFLLSVGKHF